MVNLCCCCFKRRGKSKNIVIENYPKSNTEFKSIYRGAPSLTEISLKSPRLNNLYNESRILQKADGTRELYFQCNTEVVELPTSDQD
jgi:hypothetical protein